MGRFGSLLIRGYLPPRAREAARLSSSNIDQHRCDRFQAMVRVALSALPREWRYVLYGRKAGAAATAR